MTDVFISYSRSSARPAAVALYRELGGSSAGLAFLDTEEIEHGDRFPNRLIDALLEARVIVVFADQVYFTRWYCLFEYRAALSPHRAISSLGTNDDDLHHVVIALPPAGLSQEDWWHLPPQLTSTDWPKADDPAAIARLVRKRLLEQPHSLGALIDKDGSVENLVRELRESALLERPQLPHGDMPVVPASGLPLSLGDGFVGRADDLWRIHEALTFLGGNGAPIVALEGGAGVGKSRLALEYLHRFGARRHPGGWFWIDAGRPPEPQWDDILQELNRDPRAQRPTGPSEDVGVSLTKALRAIDPAQPAIVIVDNIPEPAGDAPPDPIERYCPAAGFVPMLVSSRQRVSLASGGAIRSLPLEVLDRNASVLLLSRDLPQPVVAGADLERIADQVGRLPLALELLNRALVFGSWTPNVLATRLHAADTTPVLEEASKALRATVPAGTLRGVTEALSVSVEALPKETRIAAQLLSWLAPMPIPDELLAAFEPDRFDSRVRAELVARSVVTRAEVAGTFGVMHVVLADFLHTVVQDPESQLDEVARAILGLFTPQRAEDPREWPLLRASEPHIRALYRRLQRHPPLLHPLVALGSVLSTVLGQQTRFSEASSLGLETLLLASDEDGVIPVGRYGELDMLLWNLPNWLASTGDPQELTAAITWQRVNVEASNNDPQKLAIAEDNLANLLRRRGTDADLDEAQSVYGRTIPFWKDADPRSMETATALNNLALVHMGRNRPAEAVPLLEEALTIVEGIKHAGAERANGKATLAAAVAETDPAREEMLLESALSEAEDFGLPDDYETVRRVLRTLGAKAYEQGDYSEAARMLSRALDATAELYPVTDPAVTGVAWELYASQLWGEAEEDAAQTRERYLQWLETAQDEDLNDDQRNVRDELAERGPG